MPLAGVRDISFAAEAYVSIECVLEKDGGGVSLLPRMTVVDWLVSVRFLQARRQ